MRNKFYKTKYTNILTKKLLIKEYLNNKKSFSQIMKKYNVSSSEIIGRYLKRFNIKIRTKIEGNKLINRKKEHNSQWQGGLPKCKLCGKELSHYKNRIGYCHQCMWLCPGFRNRVVEAQQSKKGMNKPEKLLNNFLQRILPKEYKFVGNGKVILGGFNPDFINVNGQKKIIELYGDYWHNLPNNIKRDKGRYHAYKRYGYRALIVWEHELKNLKKVKNKILKFHGGKK